MEKNIHPHPATSWPPSPLKGEENVLVIKLSALGDFILCFAAFAAIRAHHPDAKITLLTTKSFAGLAEKSPWFDEIILDNRPGVLDIGGWMKLRARLRGGNFSRVYDLQTNDRTSFYFRLFFPGPFPEWAGKSSGAKFRVGGDDWEKLHAWDMRRETLRAAGIADTPFPDLNFLDADISRFKVPDRFTLICAGAAPTRPLKRWPPAHYAEVCKYLLSQNITPVLIGADAEKEINAEIKSAAPGAIDLTGQTNLFDIAALARRAAAAIGNDTGPMHLIAVCGTPSLSLFSNDSSPAHSRPMGPRTAWLQRDDLKDLKPAEVIPAILLR